MIDLERQKKLEDTCIFNIYMPILYENTRTPRMKTTSKYFKIPVKPIELNLKIRSTISRRQDRLRHKRRRPTFSYLHSPSKAKPQMLQKYDKYTDDLQLPSKTEPQMLQKYDKYTDDLQLPSKAERPMQQKYDKYTDDLQLPSKTEPQMLQKYDKHTDDLQSPSKAEPQILQEYDKYTDDLQSPSKAEPQMLQKYDKHTDDLQSPSKPEPQMLQKFDKYTDDLQSPSKTEPKMLHKYDKYTDDLTKKTNKQIPNFKYTRRSFGVSSPIPREIETEKIHKIAEAIEYIASQRAKHVLAEANSTSEELSQSFFNHNDSNELNFSDEFKNRNLSLSIIERERKLEKEIDNLRKEIDKLSTKPAKTKSETDAHLEKDQNTTVNSFESLESILIAAHTDNDHKASTFSYKSQIDKFLQEKNHTERQLKLLPILEQFNSFLRDKKEPEPEIDVHYYTTISTSQPFTKGKTRTVFPLEDLRRRLSGKKKKHTLVTANHERERELDEFREQLQEEYGDSHSSG